MPAFAYRHIKELYPIFWDKSRQFVENVAVQNERNLDSEKVSNTGIDVCEWARRVTLDVIGLAGLGRDFNSIKDPNNELHKTYNNLFSMRRGQRVLGILGLFLPRWLIRNLP